MQKRKEGHNWLLFWTHKNVKSWDLLKFFCIIIGVGQRLQNNGKLQTLKRNENKSRKDSILLPVACNTYLPSWVFSSIFRGYIIHEPLMHCFSPAGGMKTTFCVNIYISHQKIRIVSFICSFLPWSRNRQGCTNQTQKLGQKI